MTMMVPGTIEFIDRSTLHRTKLSEQSPLTQETLAPTTSAFLYQDAQSRAWLLVPLRDWSQDPSVLPPE